MESGQWGGPVEKIGESVVLEKGGEEFRGKSKEGEGNFKDTWFGG